MVGGARRAAPVLAGVLCLGLVGGQRMLQPGEVAGQVVEYQASTDAHPIEGYTTWEVSILLGGQTHNVYTFAGTDDHMTTIPPARQVAAPFGSEFGGVNPQYFVYNDECEFDSWLTGKSPRGGLPHLARVIAECLCCRTQSVSSTMTPGWVISGSTPTLGMKRKALRSVVLRIQAAERCFGWIRVEPRLPAQTKLTQWPTLSWRI
jgi:hypothetical protein